MEQKRRQDYWNNARAIVERYNFDLTSIMKKLKSLNKKLREISDIVSKLSDGISISSEQQVKVSRKSDVETEVIELMKEEAKLSSNKPIFDESIPKPDMHPRNFFVHDEERVEACNKASIFPVEVALKAVREIKLEVKEQSEVESVGNKGGPNENLNAHKKGSVVVDDDSCWETVRTVKGKKKPNNCGGGGKL